MSDNRRNISSYFINIWLLVVETQHSVLSPWTQALFVRRKHTLVGKSMSPSPRTCLVNSLLPGKEPFEGMSSICLPPDFDTFRERKTPALPALEGVLVECTYSVWGSPISSQPPHPGTYVGFLSQPRVQCPFPDILGRTKFEEKQQEAQSPEDLPSSAAHPAAGRRHFFPDVQRREALSRRVGPTSEEKKCAQSARLS